MGSWQRPGHGIPFNFYTFQPKATELFLRISSVPVSFSVAPRHLMHNSASSASIDPDTLETMVNEEDAAIVASLSQHTGNTPPPSRKFDQPAELLATGDTEAAEEGDAEADRAENEDMALRWANARRVRDFKEADHLRSLLRAKVSNCRA